MTSATSTRMMSFKRLLRAGKVFDNVDESVLAVSFNSHVAEVLYEKDGEIYELIHTKIPDELQGHGLGTIFAEKIFDYLVERNKKFKLSCEFLDRFYAQNINRYRKYVIEE